MTLAELNKREANFCNEKDKSLGYTLEGKAKDMLGTGYQAGYKQALADVYHHIYTAAEPVKELEQYFKELLPKP